MTQTIHDGQALVLALASIGKLGPVKIKALLAKSENPLDILTWQKREYCAIPGISENIAERIMAGLDIDAGRRMVDWAEDRGFSLTTLIDSDYPVSLRKLYDPPPFLFISGNIVEKDSNAVAIVGSRNATEYGKATSARLAGELARNGVTVVSGMALGVDSSAHRGALASGGRTIAVIGSGIDIVYPRQNKKLAEEISACGAVVSEFLPGTEPSPYNFPQRNRVIAGLSRAVVVTEAGHKSGALITADMALTQEKELFAIPGQVTSALAEGSNDLIKAGARLLTSVEDIFSVLPALKNDYIGPTKHELKDLTDGESLVYTYISDTPVQLDALVRKSGLSVTDATSYLLSLELRGIIKQLSGRRFIAV